MAAAKRAGAETDLGQLQHMNVGQLQALHRNFFGEEHPISNAGHLRRKLAWHLQAKKYGGLPESARQHALAIARDVA